jgi:RHS repeat-associated protein
MSKFRLTQRYVVQCVRAFALALVMLAASQSVHAQQAIPGGTKGWWYFISMTEGSGYAADPITACKHNALNNMGTPLLEMRPNADGSFGCKYSHVMQSVGAHWYTTTWLACEPGYHPRNTGVCVKNDETPAPSSCLMPDLGGAGASVGNPVQLASGAKVQTEIDLVAGPDLLRIERTYRSLRMNGMAQSAGQGWSFSFDRDFMVDRGSDGQGKPYVSGTLGDGSFFQFDPQTDGSFRSRYDKRLTLQALSMRYDDWMLTVPNGQIERYTKVGDVFLLVSSQAREGKALHYTYDANHQLTQIGDLTGRSVHVGWSKGRIASIDGPDGGAHYDYDEATVPGQADIEGMGRLAAVHFHDRTGSLLGSRRYHYEDERQRYLLTGITDENGVRFATYGYNDASQAVLSEHAGGAGRHAFAYPAETTRVVTDPLGTARTYGVLYAADGRGRITGESQPAGAGCSAGASAMTYAPSGDLASSTDFNGQKTCFANDPNRGLETRRISGLPASMSCPAGADAMPTKAARMVSTQWHPDWPLVSGVAEAYRIVTNVYNGERGADGQVQQCAGGATLPNGKPVAVLCSQTVQATTDSNGTLGFSAARTGPARVWRYTYNRTGQLLTRTGPTDAAGNVDSARLTYYSDTSGSHAAGDLASVTNGAGEVTQFLEYSADGLATQIKRPNGQTVALTYGPRQRLATSTVTDSGGTSESTRYTYDDAGQLTRVVAPDGSATEYSYDAAHRLTGLRDGAGNTIHLDLDNMGNVIRQEVRGAAGELVTSAQRTYDALNRLQKAQRDAGDAGTSFAYDRGGNLTALTDPLGRVTTQSFDNFDRVLAQALPAATPGAAAPVIGFSYSNQDQLLSVTDPRKLTTRYTVDGFGQQTSIASPDTGTTTSQFDGAGNPDSSTDASGRKTVYRFDAARRVTQIGSSTFEYGKDGSGATGRLTVMRDDSGQTSYTYDGFGRLLAKNQTVGIGAAVKTFALAYAYGSAGTAVGHVTSMTYPSGNRVDIAYGSDGRAISLTVTPPGASPVTILQDIRYLPFGAVRGWTWGNSTTANPNIYQRGFDLDGRIVSYPLGHPANNGIVRTLSYDAAGRITASRHAGGPTAALLDQRYDYDGLDRLTGFAAANTSQRFGYDANGNRTQATFGANTYLNTINAASNRLTSTTGPAPARGNSYDAAGNLTNDGTIQYSYGSDGRLSSVLRAGVTTAYRYNGLGQRVATIGAAVMVHYMYDETGRVIGEYDGKGAAMQETVYLDDLPVAVLKPGTNGSRVTAGTFAVNYVYADHLSTARVLTRASDNKMVWRWDGADPFGLDQPDQDPSRQGELTYNPRFPGQMFDRETNNNYNYFRDYDPQTGRYIESDPIGLAGGINTYGYVEGNPVSHADPLGLCNCGRILSDALNHNNDSGYGYDGNKGPGRGTNKCNAYVDDALDHTDVAPRRHFGFGGPISAGTWADPAATIPNFPVVQTPQPGDIVAIAHHYGDASGHVAIVEVPGKSSLGAGENGSHRTGWPWDKGLLPRGTPVYRRCTCQ